jgi:hypothetical protein
MSDNKCHVTNVTVFFDDIYHRIIRHIYLKWICGPKGTGLRGLRAGEETGMEGKGKEVDDGRRENERRGGRIGRYNQLLCFLNPPLTT